MQFLNLNISPNIPASGAAHCSQFKSSKKLDMILVSQLSLLSLHHLGGY